MLFWCLVTFSGACAQNLPVARGFTWGQVRFPSSFEALEKNDLITEGAIEQGVDWFSRGTWLIFNTFGLLGYKTDSAELDFNNNVKPALGVKLKFIPTDWALIEVGGKYEWEYRWITDRIFEGWTGFLNWSAYWILDRQSSATGGVPIPAAYTVSTWGQFRYPSAQEDEEKQNAIVEGALRGDIIWRRFKGVASVGTLAEFEYAADTTAFDFNNKFKFAFGLVLQFTLLDGVNIELGSKYVADYRPVTNRFERGLVGFLSWYASW